MNRLAGKTGIVTGGAVGIGRACVIRMAEEDARVAIFDVRLEIRHRRSGGLHVMVNNAGISGSPKPTDQVAEEEWDRVPAVNVKGVFFGTKHAIPHLRAAGVGRSSTCLPSPG